MTITGKVKCSAEEDVADVIDTDETEELEVHPVSIATFEADGVTHIFRHPIAVTVEPDGTGHVYMGVFEELGLCVYVERLDEMLQEILDDLAWRWTTIAMADEDELAPDAIAVRSAFLDLVDCTSC